MLDAYSQLLLNMSCCTVFDLWVLFLFLFFFISVCLLGQVDSMFNALLQ